MASGTGTIQPAFANSPVQITSMPMMSIESSSAPRRRTSCSRWPSASEGRYSKAIVYSPFDSSEQRSATACGAPLGSLKMNQVSSVEPLPDPSSEPQPATSRASPLRAAAASRFLLNSPLSRATENLSTARYLPCQYPRGAVREPL